MNLLLHEIRRNPLLWLLAFVPTLSDWRSLNVAVRVSSVTIQGAEDLAVKGSVILESVIGK